MKKLFLLLALMGMVAVGCSKDDADKGNDNKTEQPNDNEGGSEDNIPENIFFGLDKDSVTISPDGGSVDVIVYSNYKWEISSTSDWCTPSANGGDANEDGQKVSFSADIAYDDREATFWFRCADEKIKFVVSQKLKEVIIPDANNTFNIPAEGGVAVISYQTSVDCEVVIPKEAQDWITIAPASRGLVSENINLDISENTTYSARTAVIKVVAKDNAELAIEYTINQEQNDAILADENNTFTVPSAGGEVVINYQTNIDCDVIIPEEAQDWITIAPATRGLVSENINLDIAENTTYSARTAVIKVVAKGNAELVIEYTIEQMQNDDIIFEGDVLLTPAKGGSVVLDYQANIDCEVIIPDEVKDWISIEPQTRGLEQYSVTLVLAPNDSFDERTATIKVEGETVSRDIEVKQMGIERVLSLTPSTLDLPLDATTVTVEVETNIDYEVVIPEDCDWITIPESESASENKVIFAFTENPTIYSRNTEILFKGDGKDVVLPVIQRGDEGIIILNEEYIIDGQETVLSIEFGSNFDYTVSIPDTCDWLSLPETRAMVQNHTIEFALTKNPNLDSRSVEVLFSDTKDDVSKSVKITQLGSPLYCVVPNDNEILYKTTNGEKLNISETDFGSATVVSHTYEDGVGRITCSSNITELGNELFYHCSTLEQVAIPDSVTTIGDYAFSGCSSLTSITIPDSVTTIRDYTFSGCSSLTSVTIPDSVTTIGDYAFWDCSSLTSVTIPDSVTEIGSYAFRNCRSLESVTIPDSVTTIGKETFYGCSSLTSVTIPDSVTTIGYNAFYGCSSLTSVTIPDSVTTIGKWTFYNCSSLTSVTIPDSVTSIGYAAFRGCTSLTSVTIGDNVTSIGERAFYDCSSLTSVTIPDSVTEIGSSAFYNCISLESATIGDSVTTIGDEAFYNCTSLKSINIPESVTLIGEKVFYGCTGELIINNKIVETDYTYNNYPSDYGWLKEAKFTKLTIGDSVTTIGSYAFKNCTSLTSINIPESVTSIGKEVFYGCTGELTINNKIVETDYDSSYYPLKNGWLYGSNFTSLIIGNGVTSIGDWVFYKCSSLTSVTIPDSITSIGDYTFSGCSSLTSVTIPDSVTEIGSSAFSGCSSLTSVTIPDSITSIGESTFNGCSSLKSVTIPDSVTTIGDYAFAGCSSLTSVTIPDSVTTIGNSAFYNCSSLTSVTIPDSVTSIGNWVFYKCSSLTSVTIPNSITSIGERAFYDCSSLTSVTIPNSITSIGEEAFYNCDSLTSVTIPDSVTTIGEEAFYNCDSLTSVTIGDSVTTIGDYAFCWCDSLTSVYINDIAAWCNISFSGSYSNPLYYANNLYLNNELVTDLIIPNSVTTIGDYAFYWCESLTSVTIPDSVTTIGDSAFYDCRSLTSVTIPDSVTTIGEEAFKYCSSLTSVTIPDSVTSIGDDAFYGCTGELIVNCNIPSASSSEYGVFYGSEFTKVKIGNGVTSIGDYAFYNCPNLKSVSIGSGVTSIGKEAFWGCTGELIINNKIVEKDYNSSNYPFKYGWLYGSKFTSLIIGNGVTSIGDWVFYKCSSLTSVTISDSITSIGCSAFENCDSLTTVTIGNDVTSIGERAFKNCDSLTSINIPKSVTSIGKEVFYGCTGELIINSKIVETDYTYNNYPSYYGWLKEAKFTKLTIGDSVTTIGCYAFRGCSSLTSVTIPNSVTEIEKNAFANCSSLTSVTIPDSVTSIGGGAFSGCDSLTSVTIPDSVTEIRDEVFHGCSSLRSITIPNSVTAIGKRAFSGCWSLLSVTIPDSVTSIGEKAFEYCTSLTRVYCKATTPPAGGYDMFYNNASNRKIYVPTESVNKYKRASGWNLYDSYIVGYNF